MPGMTAWYGLNKVIEPKAGETIVVSAASGAVGSVVGQLARLVGCRTVGIAGGREKCDYVTGELGFDACVDYKAAADRAALDAALKEAAPNGVDGYFENVGGTGDERGARAAQPVRARRRLRADLGLRRAAAPRRSRTRACSSSRASRCRASSCPTTCRCGRRD